MTDLTNLIKDLDDALVETKREVEIIKHMLLHARVALNRQRQIVSSLKVEQDKLDTDLRFTEEMAKQAQLTLDMAIHNKARCGCRTYNCAYNSRISVARFHRDIKLNTMRNYMIYNHINSAKLTAAEKKDHEMNIMFAKLTHFSGYVPYQDLNGLIFKECVKTAQDIVKMVNEESKPPTIAETTALLFGQSRLQR